MPDLQRTIGPREPQRLRLTLNASSAAFSRWHIASKYKPRFDVCLGSPEFREAGLRPRRGVPARPHRRPSPGPSLRGLPTTGSLRSNPEIERPHAQPAHGRPGTAAPTGTTRGAVEGGGWSGLLPSTGPPRPFGPRSDDSGDGGPSPAVGRPSFPPTVAILVFHDPPLPRGG